MRWLALFLCIKAFALESMQHYLIDENQNLTPELVELVKLLEPEQKTFTFSEIIALTQEKWFQRGKERWQLEPRYVGKDKMVLPFLRKLGCVSRIDAARNHYNYALLMGGFTSRMQRRIDLFVETCNRGVQFDKVVMLTGERILDESEEAPAGMRTETDMFLYLYNNRVPKELQKIPLIVIDTPQQEKGRRPNTRDTIVAWLKENPSAGSCLAIGDQPFAGYFDAVFRTHLPSSFSLEVAACVADEDYSLALYLDNLARWLYQEREAK